MAMTAILRGREAKMYALIQHIDTSLPDMGFQGIERVESYEGRNNHHP